MKGRFYIFTFGCQMNEYDSEYLRRLLLRSGWEQAESMVDADLIMVNTCTVRKKPEIKALSLIGRLCQLKKKNQNLKIGLMGCLAEHKGEEIFSRYPGVNFVIGPGSLSEISGIIQENNLNKRFLAKGIKSIPCLPPVDVREKKVTAFVSIMQGCNNYCSYCVVPYVRGPERSRNYREIIAEIELLVEEGVKEITLLGQNVNSYLWNDSIMVRFPDLLRMISRVDGLKRIRFTTSHPKDLTDELISCFKDIPKLCNHIHLPFQAGSNRILSEMGRSYTREHYLNLVGKLREACPDISITTDVMVGFPGETEKDFQDTLDLMERVQFDMAFSFKYSDREGTRAYHMTNKVPEEEKIRRLSVLQELQKNITLEKNRKMVGKVFEVLVEGKSKDGLLWMGRTTNNKIVNFRCDHSPEGDFLNVKITEALNNSLRGEAV